MEHGIVVGVSPLISSLCYSVLRIEPYGECPYRCIYCYGRWYSRRAGVSWESPSTLRRVARYWRKRGLRKMPLRLSTLTEPFQPLEETARLSLKIMRICAEYGVPLLINTKSVLLREEPWRSALLKLSEKSLVVLQVTLVTLREGLAAELEPGAPSPEERLELCEWASGEGVPVVVRYQPVIPGIFELEAGDMLSQLKAAGVGRVVAESLRCSREELLCYRRLAPNSRDWERSEPWEPYSPRGRGDLVRPSLEWRIRAVSALAEIARKKGLGFATCKEGLFEYHTVPNCCSIDLLEAGEVALRPTLYEAWAVARRWGRVPLPEELFGECCSRPEYLCGEKLKEYPRILRKGLRGHEKVLAGVLRDPTLLERVAPSLAKLGREFK